MLRLYEKRYLHSDALIGTCEVPMPVEPQTGSYIIRNLALVRLAERLGRSCPFCPLQSGRTGCTFKPSAHTLLDGDCVIELLSELEHRCHQCPISRSQRIAP